MIRILPIILIIVVILGGLGYWRYTAMQSSLASPQTTTPVKDSGPIEVPKTAPAATLDDRVKALEDLTGKIVDQINQLKAVNNNVGSAGNVGTRLDALEAAVTALKVQVASANPSSISSSTGNSGKSTVYIPLGSGAQESDVNWVTMSTFQVALSSGQYPGYSNMQLEVTMRLNQPGGTLSARLFNVTDNTAASSVVTTTSTSDSVVASVGFTIPSANKTYVLQANTSDGTIGFLDYARIRVNF